MRIFVKDDEGYLKWVNKNPSGYVLNTYGYPGTDYVVLHHSSCGTISSTTIKNYTTGRYIKVCATNPDELEAWARDEGSGSPYPCGLCKPELPGKRKGLKASEDNLGYIGGFENWIRGYQNFYEPIVLAHFMDLGFKVDKRGGTIEKNDLRHAADKLKSGQRKCSKAVDKKKCIKHFRTRTRIQTDGLLHKNDPEGNEVVYSMECKSWGGFCGAVDTLAYFKGSGGWFMLVDKIRDNIVAGSVLVVGGNKPKDAEKKEHDDIIKELRDMYKTHIEAHYLNEIFANPGPNMRVEIRKQLNRLDKCVENIKAQMTVDMGGRRD